MTVAVLRKYTYFVQILCKRQELAQKYLSFSSLKAALEGSSKGSKFCSLRAPAHPSSDIFSTV